MYIPPSFRSTDLARLAMFMERYSFATLITHDGAAPFASHLPMRYLSGHGEQGLLVSHMARANPQWQQFTSDQEILAIFQGPHSYVSPAWYQTEPAVPTWNYAAVHAYGIPQILDDHERVISLLNETVAFYESAFDRPWPGNIPDDYRDQLIRSIVAFQIRITRIEGKFKLSQNRSEDDIQGVIDALSGSSDTQRQQLAVMMQSNPDVAE